jgi:hypothetical protein
MQEVSPPKKWKEKEGKQGNIAKKSEELSYRII